ncbi:CoA ester lyase [Afifella sp. H1R]|uniref:HpcH/HpaI aldolase/citrate lyase family protein n=1 Tax=Afifella sp. H1R TaxID=2908841 RepID=UPI001F256145|nr:CoA ester lyase [Afifella sp. H1R]
MMGDTRFPFLPLFVPADRPERFGKAAASGADAVIIDLEDAVAPPAKEAAREGLGQGLAGLKPGETEIYVRLNGADTGYFADDLEAVATLPLTGIVLPKAEDPAILRIARETLGANGRVIALVETPLGIVRARELAQVADRLAFGSLDYAVAIGARHVRHALDAARQELVLASACAGLAGPIDGVTTTYRDEQAVVDDAAYAADLGFGGKLLIHPAQIAPAIRGFSPTGEEVARAEKILSALTEREGGAVSLDGAMVDAPVVKWAQTVKSRALRLQALQTDGEAEGAVRARS